MRRLFISIVSVIIFTATIFLGGCSLGEQSREDELKSTLKTTYDELNSTFSGDTGKYSLVSEYLYSWAKKNELTVAENQDSYMVIENPATSGYEDSESTVLQCSVETSRLNASMQPLAVSLTALLGPESHGPISLIITENNDGNYTGAAAVDPKYYKCDNFINMQYGSETSLLTSGADAFTGTMTSDISTSSPSYSQVYSITMSTEGYSDPFDFDLNYPNPVETIGSLLATQKSSGNLFQIASFNCEYTEGYTPTSATAVVVIDGNDVESFTRRFNNSYENVQEKFADLDEHFVYTMTETSMPSSVISNNYSDNIISLMYTLQTGIYLQDEDTGEIISASDISSISTDGGDLNVVINSRSLDAGVLQEMSDSFATTSGLCDIQYSASDTKKTWSADGDKDLAQFFLDALSFDESNGLSTIKSSELDIFSSKVSGLNAISYTFNSENREAAMLNLLHFLESRVTND